eukprot:scaffold118928_cov20-Tisochrysis_lutea.AAC.1
MAIIKERKGKGYLAVPANVGHKKCRKQGHSREACALCSMLECLRVHKGTHRLQGCDLVLHTCGASYLGFAKSIYIERPPSHGGLAAAQRAVRGPSAGDHA